ncbi:hypothetical protein HPE56_02470 [Maribacter sp. ANRC-HE7]|uniref:Sensor of ECF-type sigma factor n=1 Tax=Maribacter aquimaris TaxID=2737171 RepID=A0ABR7UYD7_9FLAO|nr:hypothetical protein [Maribacter aquimaris]MBD0776645.1 hypothetical protein [Maribacter aquimaris]
MINYKNITVLLLLLFITTFTFGQRKPDKEKIRTLKVAYLTEQLEFTTSEAEAFWPIYNTYQDKMDAFRNKERAIIYDKTKDMESLSEQEANTLLEDLLALENEKSQENKQFLKNIQKVISAKKTFLLLKSENGFKRHLLKQYHQKRNGGQR